MNREHDHSKYERWIDPNETVPYERNAKLHTEKQISNICNSIRRFGWQQDTVITADNVLVIGHGRRLAAIKLGCMMPYHVIDKKADELTDDDIRELRIADNQTNAETGYDFELLDDEIKDLDFEGFDFDFKAVSDDLGGGNPYTGKTNVPQYEVSGEPTLIEELCDFSKRNALVEEIEESSLGEKEKAFLKAAADRHVVFNYRKIAEYYANADEEMQNLMERSALVIIDYDDAIANGYAVLSKKIAEMREAE